VRKRKKEGTNNFRGKMTGQQGGPGPSEKSRGVKKERPSGRGYKALSGSCGNDVVGGRGRKGTGGKRTLSWVQMPRELQKWGGMKKKHSIGTADQFLGG